MDDIRIDEAGVDDLRDVLRLYLQLHPEDPPVDSKHAEAVWIKILQTEHRKVLLARHKSEVVGSVEYCVWYNLTRSARPFVVLENLVVLESCRRTGVGSVLVQAVKNRTSMYNPYKIQLAVALDGPVHFYEARGFADSGLVMKFQPLDDCS